MILFRSLITLIIDSLFKIKFNIYLLRFYKNKEFVVFDLDNTLAHTYPYINTTSIRETYNKLPVHTGLHKLLLNQYESGFRIIILTARDWKYFFETKNWIRDNINTSRSIPFFLVNKPHHKLWYLNKIILKGKNLTYYDDLSYNHENGIILYYEDMIKEVRKLNINYFDYSEILKINANN